ncbi:MAG: EEP domain-containing protein [Chelatococcus sp.]|nr:MAG: EEP domain-containing protein [Chelatococcus sp.]
MKVASYNIHKCRGTDRRVRPDRTVAVLAEIGADLVALQEVDRRFGQRTGLLDPAAILRETGMHLLVQSDVVDGHGWHGNALLVRGEPASYRRFRLKLPGVEPRGAVVAELDLGEGRFRVIAAHLGLLRRSRIDQASALLHAFLELAPMPTILLGDFNEWRRDRKSALNILEPHFGSAKHLPSFPSRRPMLALDRILAWPSGLVSDLAVHDTPLARKASDHLPLTARVDIARCRVGLEKAA